MGWKHYQYNLPSRLHITPSGSPNTSLQQSLNVSAGGPQTRSTPLAQSSPAVFTESYTTSSTRRGVKRRRLNQEDFVSFDQTAKSWKVESGDWTKLGCSIWQSKQDAVGDVVIDDVDTEGKFIKLTNKGDEDVSISNWMLKSTAGDREVSFKFHSRAKIPAGKTMTVTKIINK